MRDHRCGAILGICLFLLGFQAQAMKPAKKRCALLLERASQSNPLIRPSVLDFGALPYDEIKPAHFKPALYRKLRQARRSVEAIRTQAEPPTFANTIEALESVGLLLDPVDQILGDFALLQLSDKMEAVSEQLYPIISRFSDSIYLDLKIFHRVEMLYQKRETLGLTVEQKTLLEKTYREFVRNGVHFPDSVKSEITELGAQLTVLSKRFQANLKAETDKYELWITDRAELAGLPDRLIQVAAEEAQKRGKAAGWVFNLDMPSFLPFMENADNRALREKIWRASNARATSGEHDNRPVLIEIAKIRLKLATLRGYESHAHFQMEDRMVKTPETTQGFLKGLAAVLSPLAREELRELREFAGQEDLQPWDLPYYSRRLKQSRYAFDEEELRPYFSYDRVMEGAFYVAKRLYGISFVPRNDLPVWPGKVDVYEVRDRNQKHLGLLYLDPFPRKGKSDGAWNSSLRRSGNYFGEHRRAHVVNAGDLTPPSSDKPALLSLSDVETVFHELGHGLHCLLSQAKYASLSGTSVAWDFVELPSQIFENWALQPEVLDFYARHHQTGEKIPTELLAKLHRSKNFQAGMMWFGQVGMSQLDLAWHSKDVSSVAGPDDVLNFENQVLAPYQLLPNPGYARSTRFDHIFEGGYSAGYYSYLWSRNLAADAFEIFERAGVFNSEVAHRFQTEILERGGTEEALVLYRRFTGGRDPDPAALIRQIQKNP